MPWVPGDSTTRGRGVDLRHAFLDCSTVPLAGTAWFLLLVVLYMMRVADAFGLMSLTGST